MKRLAIKFTFYEYTRNMVRFRENHPVDAAPTVGWLYVAKAAFGNQGAPPTLTATIEFRQPGGDDAAPTE